MIYDTASTHGGPTGNELMDRISTNLLIGQLVRSNENCSCNFQGKTYSYRHNAASNNKINFQNPLDDEGIDWLIAMIYYFKLSSPSCWFYLCYQWHFVNIFWVWWHNFIMLMIVDVPHEHYGLLMSDPNDIFHRCLCMVCVPCAVCKHQNLSTIFLTAIAAMIREETSNKSELTSKLNSLNIGGYFLHNGLAQPLHPHVILCTYCVKQSKACNGCMKKAISLCWGIVASSSLQCELYGETCMVCVPCAVCKHQNLSTIFLTAIAAMIREETSNKSELTSKLNSLNIGGYFLHNGLAQPLHPHVILCTYCVKQLKACNGCMKKAISLCWGIVASSSLQCELYGERPCMNSCKSCELPRNVRSIHPLQHLPYGFYCFIDHIFSCQNISFHVLYC